MQGFFQCFFNLYRPLVSRLNELLSKYGLSYSLWQVILYLKINGPSTLVDIASHYNIEKPSITRRVHLLEEKLLVKAVTGGRDRREKVIQLTEKAENLYAICRERITELEYLAMTGIPEEEQRTVFEVLPKIKNNIQEKEDR